MQERQYKMVKHFHEGADGGGSNLGRGTVCCPEVKKPRIPQRTKTIKPNFAVKVGCPERVGACVHS